MQNPNSIEHCIQNALKYSCKKLNSYNDFYNFMYISSITNWILDDRSRKYNKRLYIVVNGALKCIELCKYWNKLTPESLIKKLKDVGVIPTETETSDNEIDDLSEI